MSQRFVDRLRFTILTLLQTVNPVSTISVNYDPNAHNDTSPVSVQLRLPPHADLTVRSVCSFRADRY